MVVCGPPLKLTGPATLHPNGVLIATGPSRRPYVQLQMRFYGVDTDEDVWFAEANRWEFDVGKVSPLVLGCKPVNVLRWNGDVLHREGVINVYCSLAIDRLDSKANYFD